MEQTISKSLLEVLSEQLRVLKNLQSSIDGMQINLEGLQNSVDDLQKSVNGLKNSVDGVQKAWTGSEGSSMSWACHEYRGLFQSRYGSSRLGSATETKFWGSI